MYLTMLDVDKFVNVNSLKEITDPVYMQFKRATPNGLFSNEIFGISQYDRQSIWAYIDLGARFLHPLAAINFKKYGSTYENIIYGLKHYRFENGEFIEDEANGDTGIDFLYDCYDKIKWRTTESISSTERIKFLSQGKEKIFLTKFPVCPPFYRDINDNAATGIPIINEMYKKLISSSQALKNKGSFTFFGNMTKANMQKTIVDIFNHYTNSLKGKLGLMRRSVMGHNVDYGAWGVLSSPVIDCDKYTDMIIDFDHIGVPLPMVIAMFKPFILQAVKEFFANEFVRSGKYPVIAKDKETGQLKTTTVEFIDPLSEFSSDYIDSKISYFVNGYSTRFEPIKIPSNKEGIEGYLALNGRFGNIKEVSTRPMTWTDLFYIIAVDVTKNKSCMWSRYPIEHFYSIEYPLIRVLSTIRTMPVEIDGVEYKWYPIVKVGEDSSADFANTITPNNVNIGTLGADFKQSPLKSLNLLNCGEVA